jgi:hypothetical protein
MAMIDGPDVREVQTPHGTVRVRDTGGSGTPVLLVQSALVDPDLYGRWCRCSSLPVTAAWSPSCRSGRTARHCSPART